MNVSRKRTSIVHIVISSLTAMALVVGSFPSLAQAQVLSGAESNTLIREPQQTPNGLGTATFDGLQFADAASEIDLIQAPVANNQGDAQISHPLSVPPGRAGLQPELNLNYSSYGGNGWVGLGWGLSLGEVTIDTRWGVPRYDSAQETETYLLDGEMLSPTAVRSPLLDRATDRVFKRRVEGEFERVVRHGTAPGSYWWEVTDKSGTSRYYGGTPEDDRIAAAILADDNGNGFHWALTQVRDISNNTMTFSYSIETGTGVGSSGGDLGREIYLDSIRYTGSVASAVINDIASDPAYEVRFIRASQLGEDLRPDVSIDGRGGFLRVTSDLLRRIDVFYRGALTSRYGLSYTERAFRKTLLDNVTQAGSDGVVFATHTFSYYDDVRPDGSTYEGFATGADWDTIDDDVDAGIDLGAFGDSAASALGGAESLGGDGRAYIGFNGTSPTKENSFGGGFVLAGDDSMSRLELLDINGDNLPDKVFEENGQVFYRLNTTGPDGAIPATFGDKRPVIGLSKLSSETSFQFGIGPEAYPGAASIIYNHAWAWSWGKAYFIDVNTDGLVDFVNNGTVSFNSLDANGNPVFITDSGQTGVPIESAAIDSSILADFSDIADQQREQSPLQDTLRRWTAPWAGTIQIEGDVQLLKPIGVDPVVGDGVRLAIQHEDSELWSTLIAGDFYTPTTPTGVASILVARGDDIYFRVGSVDDGASDEVAWDPQISYTGVSETLDANGLDVYSYQASQDFTLAGRNDIFAVMPLDGTVRVEGDFVKSNKTTDDITIQVLQNGSEVGTSTTIGRDDTGTFAFTLDFNVAQNDQVSLKLEIDSPVDLSTFSWEPRLVYLSATANGEAVTVIDGDGNPILDLNAPVVTQIYPATDLIAPQTTWTAPGTGDVTIPVPPESLIFCEEDPNLLLCLPNTDLDGFVAFTVKKKITPPNAGDPPAELVAKTLIEIQNGIPTDLTPSLTFSAEAGAEYWLDLSIAQPRLGSAWQPNLLPLPLPFARHWAFVPDDVFPMPYRGWGIAGYNGDGSLATSAIIEDNLLFDEDDYPTSEPAVDPNLEFPTSDDVDPNYKNPVQGKSYAYAPVVERDATSGAVTTRQWRGSKENLFGSATGASSSRVGADSVGVPGSSDILGARAVSRFSLTEADAIAASLGPLSGSYAWGTSEGIVDFFDMNGDEFPDIVGNGGVQYSTARGGLEMTKTTLSLLSENISEDSSSGWNLGIGGTAAEIKADSRGDANTAQDAARNGGSRQRSSSANGDTGSANSTDNAQTKASLGVSGDIGLSSTNCYPNDQRGGLCDDSPFNDLLESELADINGDGLPDRIRVDKDGGITVAFNIGYGFDSNEIAWPGGKFEEGESFAGSLAPSLGFSTPTRSFSGGASISSSSEEAISTWVDLNADGLLDHIRLSGSTVKVRFGTGAGLTDDISWGDFHMDEIATSESIGLGGGLDFTIGIGPLCLAGCYIIINPGGSVEGGMTRQEVELSDVNGDGYADHIFSDSDDGMNVKLNTTGRTNLLQSVVNPLGGSFELDYTREGNTTSQAFSQWVMSRVTVNDGREGDGVNIQLTTYEYADNAYHALERDFLGYATVTERQHDDDVAETVLRTFERAYLNTTIFDSGLLERVTLLDGNSAAVKETVNTWAYVDADTNSVADPSGDPVGVTFLSRTVFPQQVRVENRRIDGGAIVKRTWNTFAYDAWGNVIEIVDVGEPDLSDDDAIATITYTDCTDPTSTWVGLPDSFEVRDGNGNLLRSRTATLLCTDGAVTQLREDTGNGEAVTDLEFNGWGSYNKITYPANENGQRYEVNYVYDTDRRTDIAQVTDSFGLVGTATYDGSIGQIASQTDANGQTTTYAYDAPGRLTSITGPYEQGTGNATVSFEYFPTAPDYAYAVAHHFDAFNPTDTIDTVSFLDGLGRETETKQDGTVFVGTDSATADVMIVSGAAEFDALGRIVTELYPITEALGSIGVYNFTPDSVNPTLTEWDVEDRVIKTTEPNGSETTTSYGYDNGSLFGTTMFLNTLTDPLGNERRTYLDIRGNVLAIEVDHDTSTAIVQTTSVSIATEGQSQADSEAAETNDGTADTTIFLPIVAGDTATAVETQIVANSEVLAAAVNAIETHRTTYVYDSLQQLATVIDAAANVTTHEYDLLGRRTATTTPDGGRVELVYDLASQVIAKITPNLSVAGGQISYVYNYNRLVGISYTDGTPSVTYTYGGVGAPNNGAGRIVGVEDGARIQSRSFGRLGQVVGETTTMLVHNLNQNTEERLTWTMAWDFDTWGRPRTVTYPDGEVVTYDYDSGGLTASAAGLKDGTAYPYVNRLEYDKFLDRRFMQTGNSVATEIRYDAQTRLLDRIITDAPGRQVQDITYTYDLVGNLLTADNDAPPPVPNLMGGTSQQMFAYDDLYRLASASGQYQFAPNKERKYTFGLAYDNLGNIVQKSQTDAIFNNPNKGIEQKETTYDNLYVYNAAPHQPTNIGDHSYTYDDNGNLTGWTDDNSGKNRTVTWDAEDRATSVADQGSTTTYKYDDEDRLAIERGPQGETSFVNRFYTVRNGTVAWKHFWVGTERIATKREMPDGVFEDMLYFLHKDLLSSTNLVTESDGSIFQYLEYFPSGETWVEEHSNVHRTPYLYTGGYNDEFRELYNLGARWYEPREQMFYSADPILVQSPDSTISDPALLGAYTYAEDNPLRLVDRTGLNPKDSQDAFQGKFARPNGNLDAPKARRLSSLVQQKGEQPGLVSRLITRTADALEGKRLKPIKTFFNLELPPAIVSLDFGRTPDGLKLRKATGLFGFFKKEGKAFKSAK